MCEVLDYNVEGLKRIQIMNINLSALQPGKLRYFTTAEILAINEISMVSSILY